DRPEQRRLADPDRSGDEHREPATVTATERRSKRGELRVATDQPQPRRGRAIGRDVLRRSHRGFGWWQLVAAYGVVQPRRLREPLDTEFRGEDAHAGPVLTHRRRSL